jgi:hypothetical protein
MHHHFLDIGVVSPNFFLPTCQNKKGTANLFTHGSLHFPSRDMQQLPKRDRLRLKFASVAFIPILQIILVAKFRL